MAHHVRRKGGLEVEEHPDRRDLLQPFAADLLAVVFIFTVVVEAKVQRPDQLLGQRAHRTHEGLAENRISSQLQLRVYTRGERVMWRDRDDM